ncbi:5'-3' exonuclease PLD4 [Alosa sapidissima]|uniref:5'-3' exonuclease PLD4 n=1 Tax=Alosa sapidissima TaxID=34773 RepID=UPI001C0801AE|nr:5'-3' exonuclease PLD4 [Alosa sapidissima]
MSRAASDTLGSCSPYERFDDVYVPKQQCSFRVIYVALSVGCLVGFAALLCFSIIEKINSEEQFTQRTEEVGNKTAIINEWQETSEQSRVELVEGIPLDLDYGPNATFGTPLYKTWKSLLSMATKQVEVASFYWTLTGEDIFVNSSTDAPGRDILKAFKALPSRNVSVHVVASFTCVGKNSTDLKELEESGVHVRRVNFRRLTNGVLHSKFWIIDRRHIYIGSPNMDWRSLTQVKELGVVIYDSPRLAHDLIKIFDSYWMMGHKNASIPEPWPTTFDTSINHERPLLVNLSGVPSSVYIAASPPSFCPESRSRDLDAILSAINEAEHFVYVAVMDYYPTTQFTWPPRYWPTIDNVLREAAFGRHVAVRLLASCGRDTNPAMLPFLRSLEAMRYLRHHISVEVKAFIVPVGNQSTIPYTRVNHNKYMVTDKVAYIGTSNWSEEYFSTTAGVGLVISSEAHNQSSSARSFQQQLRAVFLRDWDSPFAVPLNELHKYPDCRMFVA